jgi:excisionase family DNA binding protein
MADPELDDRDLSLPTIGRLHTTTEAARIMRLSPQTLRLWISQNRITVVRFGRAVRIPAAAIDTLVAHGFRKGSIE